jgi:replicative DNA helicase
MNQEERLIAAICKESNSDLLYGEIEDYFVSNTDVLQWLRDFYNRHKSFPKSHTIKSEFAHLDLAFDPDTAEIELEKLQKIHLKKSISDLLVKQNQMLKSGEDPQKVLNVTAQAVSRLHREHSPIQDVDITETEEAIKDYEARKKLLAEQGSPGIMTGLKAIDDNYPTGLAPGQFIPILAWSGRGKSWFSSLLAFNAWKQGYTPMIVSLEMNPSTVRDRLYTIAAQGALKNTELTSGEVDIGRFQKWASAEFKSEKGNKFIVIATESMDSVRPVTIQSKIEQHQPDMLIVDYHTLLDDNKMSGGAMERAKNVSRELKLLGVHANIPILDLNQATASDLSVPSSPPLIEQVAWSRSIQQDADLAIAVHLNDEKNRMEVVSRKNRHGPDFSFYLDWDINTGVVKEVFDVEQPEMEW